MLRLLLPAATLLAFFSSLALGDDAPRDADRRLSDYFQLHTERLRDDCLADINSLQQWEAARDEYRRQLREMLGIDPPPPRDDLKATVTGITEHDDFVVERLHFQSLPGLYVTANLYRPKEIDEPLPAILYVCGHAKVKPAEISYGNKAGYQHHGAWFARNGYVCLTIDTLQLGEIEGIHHGTYKYGRWWWLNRGYTPAGVEAWNCIRALDYLETRNEADSKRFGVTGRSGGGAYSWWIAALDDRIKAAVPVAGITDLENHVVDGCVEGHCDCMFMLNTYQWDYPLVAALVAPRPLLISNTDRDGIFPLDGVVRTHRLVRKIYRLYDAEDRLGLQITAGPHRDTQELRIHAFRWFNKHLKDDDRLIDMPAEKLFTPPQLQVFDKLPADQRNTRIDEEFVPSAETPPPPESQQQWDEQAAQWRSSLRARVFRGWPQGPSPPAPELKPISSDSADGITLRRFEVTSQQHVRLPLWVIHRADLQQPKLSVLSVVDDKGWEDIEALAALLTQQNKQDEQDGQDEQKEQNEQAVKLADQTRGMLKSQDWAIAFMAPRGLGPDRWSGDERKQTQIRRRFNLLGQSLDGMRVWDILQATTALRSVEGLEEAPVWLEAESPQMAGVALHAAVFKKYGRVDLHGLPADYREGPHLLNVSRFLTIPQAVALAADHSPVILYNVDADNYRYVQQLADKLGWEKSQFRIR